MVSPQESQPSEPNENKPLILVQKYQVTRAKDPKPKEGGVKANETREEITHITQGDWISYADLKAGRVSGENTDEVDAIMKVVETLIATRTVEARMSELEATSTILKAFVNGTSSNPAADSLLGIKERRKELAASLEEK